MTEEEIRELFNSHRVAFIWYQYEPLWDEISEAAKEGFVNFYEANSGTDMHNIVASQVPLEIEEVERLNQMHLAEVASYGQKRPVMANKHYVAAMASQLASMFKNSGAEIHEESSEDDRAWFRMTDPTGETVKVTIEPEA